MVAFAAGWTVWQRRGFVNCVRGFVFLKPVIQIALVEAHSLIADREFRYVRADIAIEYRAAHPEIGRRFICTKYARLNRHDYFFIPFISRAGIH